MTPSGEYNSDWRNFDRLSPLIDECNYQYAYPQDSDRYIASFAGAAYDQLAFRELGKITIRALDARGVEEIAPFNLFNLVRCAIQKQLLKHDSGYPSDGYEDPRKFYAAIEDITASPEICDEIEYDLTHRRVQTNIGERYKSHKIIMASLADRLGPEPRLMDVGCSELQGPKQLRNVAEVPFSQIAVDVYPHNPTKQQEIDVALQNALDSDLGVPGPVLGIDVREPDEGAAEWVLACTFKPNELLSGERRDNFEALRAMSADQIFGYWKGFDNEAMKGYDPQNYASDRPLDAFEVITFTTVLNQMKTDEIHAARELARSYLSDNGVIVYQDRLTAMRNNKDALELLPDYHHYNYRTFVEFGDDPRHAVHEVMRWQTGRCKVLRPGKYLLQLLRGELV